MRSFSHRYFTNDVLTKEYTLQFGFTDAKAFKSSFRNSSDLAHYDGVPKVVDCKGCKVRFSKIPTYFIKMYHIFV